MNPVSLWNVRPKHYFSFIRKWSRDRTDSQQYDLLSLTQIDYLSSCNCPLILRVLAGYLCEKSSQKSFFIKPEGCFGLCCVFGLKVGGATHSASLHKLNFFFLKGWSQNVCALSRYQNAMPASASLFSFRRSKTRNNTLKSVNRKIV